MMTIRDILHLSDGSYYIKEWQSSLFLKRCGPFEAEERNGELSGQRDSVGKY